ncbi:hypothetical protein ABTL11_20790, partial [Acinetobacter baumannii]
MVPPRLAHETIARGAEGALRIGVVADTHGRPHPNLGERLGALAPHRILLAGDIGDLAVLKALERHAP